MKIRIVPALTCGELQSRLASDAIGPEGERDSDGAAVRAWLKDQVA